MIDVTTGRQQRVSVPGIVAPAREVPRGPASEADLKWGRQKMVRWLSPPQLAMTGVRALLSSVFGSYADRREVQAALSRLDRPAPADPDDAPFDRLVYEYDDRSDPEAGFWIDYVADLGDGFDPTYTVAWLLAQPTLPRPARGQAEMVTRGGPVAGERTRRGNLLVMGGDQVYPTASRDEYLNRLAGPYEAALPWCTEGRAPHLYAVPGNHDWYDGLTAFIRLFCQRRWMGGWRTQQHRSYFALKLPARWWLLGIDVQLASDIDRPQLDYFCRVAEEHMRPGDRVILCTAEPAWVHTPTEPAAFDNLAFFEKTVLAPRGAELALTLTGDLHHYSRYSDSVRTGEARHHKITAGGGGAYLLGTQILAEEIRLTAPRAGSGGADSRETDRDDGAEGYRREAAYPSPGRSVALKWGALAAAWKNPSFALFLGVVYALFAWFVQSASKVPGRFEGSFMEVVRGYGWGEWERVAGTFWSTMAHDPGVATFTLLILLGFVAFCAPDVERSRLLRRSAWLRRAVKVGVGGAHGTAHLALAVGLLWLLSRLQIGTGPLPATGADPGWRALLFAVEIVAIGGSVGALLMGLFLLPGVNYNEAFSAQRLESYKNFLRLHIAPDGRLTVYPYGVDRPARWRFRPRAEPGAPYFESEHPPEVRLVDGPIVLAPPAGFQPTSPEIDDER